MILITAWTSFCRASRRKENIEGTGKGKRKFSADSWKNQKIWKIYEIIFAPKLFLFQIGVAMDHSEWHENIFIPESTIDMKSVPGVNNFQDEMQSMLKVCIMSERIMRLYSPLICCMCFSTMTFMRCFRKKGGKRNWKKKGPWHKQKCFVIRKNMAGISHLIRILSSAFDRQKHFKDFIKTAFVLRLQKHSNRLAILGFSFLFFRFLVDLSWNAQVGRE